MLHLKLRAFCNRFRFHTTFMIRPSDSKLQPGLSLSITQLLFNSTSNNIIFSSNVMQVFVYWQNFIKKENLLIFYHFSCQKKIEIDLIFQGFQLPEARKKRKQKSLDFYIWFLVRAKNTVLVCCRMQNKRMKKMQKYKIVSISYFKNLKELMVFM